jgi:hypothetical protein
VCDARGGDDARVQRSALEATSFSDYPS